MRETEEMLGEARDRFERNEAGRHKLTREVKSTHHSNLVNCQSQVTDDPRSVEFVIELIFEPEEVTRRQQFPKYSVDVGIRTIDVTKRLID